MKRSILVYILTVLLVLSIPAFTFAATLNLSSDLTADSLTIAAGDTVNTNGFSLDINGAITLNTGAPGGTLDATGGSAIDVSGNWVINSGGVFTAATSTVTFDGTGTQSVTSDGDLFNNLTVTNTSNIISFLDAFTTTNFTAITASSTLHFVASATSTIRGTLDLDGGASGTRIQLRSLTPGTRFSLNVTSTQQTVDYVDVQDSNASTFDIIATNSNGTSANNDDTEDSPRWFFGAAVTTIADGSDPSDSTVGPGTADTVIDVFTLTTNIGTDDVTGLTVTSASTTAIASMEIWDSGESTQYFATVNSASGDLWDFSGGSSIPVNSTTTPSYVVRATFNGHAMAAGTYTVTATVTSATTTNAFAGTDTNSATITVDNTPPADATWGANAAGNQEVVLVWTNPGVGFATSTILMATSTAVSAAPTEGTVYTADTKIATSTVIYVGSLETYTHISLNNGTDYYYKIFSGDDYNNYASGAVDGPNTPAVTNPTISSTANRSFTVGSAATSTDTITITDGPGSITAANDIRIKIPASFNMVWNTASSTATLGGTGAASTTVAVTFEDSNKTLLLAVNFDFTAGDTLTVSGLSFTNFSGASPVDNLELEINNAGSTVATDDKTITILTPGTPAISSAGNQTFAVGDALTDISTITISDGATTPSITAANDIRVVIPSGFNMAWNTASTTATISITGTGTASTTVSYATSTQAVDTLVVDVLTNFAAGDSVAISGLSFMTFSDTSSADNLELSVNGVATSTVATDDKTKTIVAANVATISSAANQTFIVDQGTAAISQITITDDNVTPTIKAETDIRIIIPAAFNMVWDSSDTDATVTVTGTGAASSTVSYADSDKTLVIDVTTNFAAGDSVAISDLSFTTFSAVSAADNLELSVNGGATTTVGTDDKTIEVVAAEAVGSADGDGDGNMDYFLDIDNDGLPDRYQDPDDGILTDIVRRDVNGDGTDDWILDTDNDGMPERVYDPITGEFIDPFGVVFDSSTNQPIAGAVVTIFDWPALTASVPGGTILATDANPQTTGQAGTYAFNALLGSNFVIVVTPPTGYSFPYQPATTVFPAAWGRSICTANAPYPSAGCFGVSGSRGEMFTQGGAVINMDFPLDGGTNLLRLTKTANKKEANIGDVITYTVTIASNSTATTTNVYVTDRIPAGFKYIEGRAMLDDRIINNPTGQRPLSFNIGTVAAGQTRTLRYQLVVGSGVTFGKYQNSAWANYANGTMISNIAKEEVKIVPDPMFDLGTVVGKVFWDINGNGVQDGVKIMGNGNNGDLTYERRIISTESGIAGVQVVTEEGTVITTDEEGRFHLQGIMPGRHIFMIDERALPEGAYLTTDKAVIVDITPGILQKVNFGASEEKHRAEMLELLKAREETLKVEAEKEESMKMPLISILPGIVVEKLEEPELKDREFEELKAEEVEAEYEKAEEEKAVEKAKELVKEKIEEVEKKEEKKEIIEEKKEPVKALSEPVPGITVEELEEKEMEEGEFRELKAEDIKPEKPVEEKIELLPVPWVDKEDLIFVALADVKAGLTSASGEMEPVGNDDKFRDGFWQEGKLAYYLKGKIKGKYLVTSSLDTDREKKEIFRNLDPDKYYPVYGDASTVNYDATNTQGMLYLAVEWDKSRAMWGNYSTGINDTEMAQFNRGLYGGKVHFETVATTKAGKPETKLIVFQAQGQQRAAHNEFLGTGGSLYYLRHKPVVEGSDSVSIQVRDKNTNLVIAEATQVDGEDYDIDYSSGRIMFYQPVSQIAESDSIISNALLDGNKLYVVVDYEYEVNELMYREWSYGIRAEQSLTSLIDKFRSQVSPKSRDLRFATTGFRSQAGGQLTENDEQTTAENGFEWLKDIRFGGTYIRDAKDTGEYELRGVDTGIYLASNTSITAEYAESREVGSEGFVSTDGGLSFTTLPSMQRDRGEAYALKAQTELFNRAKLKSYFRRVDRDFSSSSTSSQQGKESIGGEIDVKLTDRNNLRVSHDIQQLIDDGTDVTASQVGAERTDTTVVQATHLMDKLKLTGEFRQIEVKQKRSEYVSETNGEGSTVALRGDYEINQDLGVFLEQQHAFIRHGEDTYQTTAGVSAKILKWLKIRASETVGTTGNATAISTVANLDSKTEVYNTYSVSNPRSGGKQTSITTGGRKKVTDNMEFKTEAQTTSSDSSVSRTNIFGLSGDINERWGMTASYERGMVYNYDSDIRKRSAGSIGVSYIERVRLKASSKIEIRVDEGEQNQWQYLNYNAVQWQASRSTTLFGKVNLSESRNTTLGRTQAQYKELVFGSAYRPVHSDRLNLLTKYTYLEDETATGQTDMSSIDEMRAHVLAGEAVYDLTDKWQVVEKLAYKMSDERVMGFDFTGSQTWLWINRLNYDLYGKWQVAAEYRILEQRQAKDRKHGALFEVARYLGKNLQVGVGYNFTDFNDDLTYLDYTSHGPFIRLTGKITN